MSMVLWVRMFLVFFPAFSLPSLWLRHLCSSFMGFCAVEAALEFGHVVDDHDLGKKH